MSPAGVTLTKTDGNLGVPVAGATKPLLIGPSSGGTKESLYTFGQTTEVNSTIGRGPVQVAAECILQIAGGAVDVYVASASIAGTNSTPVTSSVGAMAVTGAPRDSYDFIGVVTVAGVLDAAKWKYTLDGTNYSPEMYLGSSNSIANTGLTVTAASATYAVGNAITFTSRAPQMNTTDINTCLTDYLSKNTTPTFIFLANDSQSAASGSALFTALDTQLAAQDNVNIFTQAIMPAGGVDSTSAAVLTAFNAVAATVGNIIGVVAERARRLVPSPFMGYSNPRIPFALAVAERVQTNLISTNPARYADGPLTGWSDATVDDARTSTYENAKLMAPRKFQGDAGLYLNQAVLKSPIGSDYRFMQDGRVLSRTAQITERALRRFINSNVRVVKDGTGFIDPRDKALIESYVNKQLTAGIMLPTNAEGVPGHATAVVFSLKDTNLLLTNTLQGFVNLVPLANISNIDAQAGFTDELVFATPVNPV